MKLTDSHFGVRSAVLQFGTNGQPADTMGKAGGAFQSQLDQETLMGSLCLQKNVGDWWM